MGSSLRAKLREARKVTLVVDEFKIASIKELHEMELPPGFSQIFVVPNVSRKDHMEVYVYNTTQVDIFGLDTPIVVMKPKTIGELVEQALPQGNKERDCLLIENHYDECGKDGLQVDVYFGP